MSTFRDKVSAGEFVFTGEITPPKGINTNNLLENANILKNHVDAINITDNPRSIMRLGSSAACSVLIKNKIEPIFQITCRDRNRIAIQSDLLSAWVLGIRNILVTTGDSVLSGDHKEAKPVFDVDSSQMLYIIKQLNSGIDLNNNCLDGKTNFFYGAALNPFLEPIELNIIRIAQKASQGASFFQTQPVFDINQYSQLYDQMIKAKIKTPVITGLLILKSAKMARFLNNNIPGVFVPEKIIGSLERSGNPIDYGISLAIDIGRQLRHMSNGFHVMSIGLENRVSEVINGIKHK